MRNFLKMLFGSDSRKDTEKKFSGNCPINEQTGDGVVVGRCWFSLENGVTCPRHGDVSKEVQTFNKTGKLTLENERENCL